MSCEWKDGWYWHAEQQRPWLIHSGRFLMHVAYGVPTRLWNCDTMKEEDVRLHGDAALWHDFCERGPTPGLVPEHVLNEHGVSSLWRELLRVRDGL